MLLLAGCPSEPVGSGGLPGDNPRPVVDAGDEASAEEGGSPDRFVADVADVVVVDASEDAAATD
jgi:hypothetical protein